jgi:hypothetical protein
VALEIVDRGPDRRLAGEREGLDECELPLAGGLLAQERLDRPSRLDDEARGPALDEVEQRRRPPRGKPGEELLGVRECLEGVGVYAIRRAATSR